MQNAQRLGLIAVAVLAVIVAFVVLRPSGGDSGSGGSGRTGRKASPAPPARIVVRGGKPVGGVRTIKVRKGDTVRFTVRADAPEEVHLHGYDIARPVGPARLARYRFRAKLEGVFDIELERSGTPIASLEVQP